MTARSVWRTPVPAWVKRIAPLTLVIAAHAVVLLGLLSLAPVRNALNVPAVLTIDMIRPPPPPPPPMPPVARKEPPKPKEVAVARTLPQPVPQLPLLVAPADAPSPVVIAEQPETPRVAPPVEAAPAPAAPAPAPKPPAAPKVVTAVEYVRAPQPQYPATARRRGEQGRVMLRVLVNTQGQPERAEVQQSSGVAALDDAARRAALQALFKPHLENGQPVPVWAIVPIIFSLEG
ncbi:MAG: TonB family protein [Betaproteobacteria bacterium]|nr:TonB family protein [Betaproteobacteria bacterium]